MLFTFAIFLFLFPLISKFAFAYHAKNYKLWPLIEIATDTHSVITKKAYSLGMLTRFDHPDLIKSEFKKEILNGDSDEKEAHQGSDKLAGDNQNTFAWFGRPDLHWKKLLEDYKSKKFDEAYHRVGVLLHLTADATSPSHVRICPHGAGGEKYFGATKRDTTDSQANYTSSIIPFPLSLLYSLHIDNFEKRTDYLAIRNQIPLEPNLSPVVLKDPVEYMEKAREEAKKELDSNSYWDSYWTKKVGFVGWGTYGNGKDTFGRFKTTDDQIVFSSFNRAVAYTAGQLQKISEKLPPIAENFSLSPATFDDQGTSLSFQVLENRTPTVKVKISVNNQKPIADVYLNTYNGSFTLNLDKTDKSGELPYYKKYITKWEGGLITGKLSPGKGEIVLEVVDEDDNASDPITIPFEYLGKGGKTEKTPSSGPTLPPDKSVKTVGQAPAVNSVSYTQLHADYEEVPHRYLLKASASDLEGGKLSYSWTINCGYFVNQSSVSEIEWRYNTPGECINAVVSVTVKDSDGLTGTKSQKVF